MHSSMLNTRHEMLPFTVVMRGWDTLRVWRYREASGSKTVLDSATRIGDVECSFPAVFRFPLCYRERWAMMNLHVFLDYRSHRKSMLEKVAMVMAKPI